MKINAFELTQSLIACPSITPDESPCLSLISDILSHLGFTLQWFNHEKIRNLWAVYGKEGPIFCFAGHTDVVPVGDEKAWRFPPFKPTVSEGMLYGRGAADMKSGLAAMLAATAQFLETHPKPKARIAFLLTTDEEGPGIYGTRYAIEQLSMQKETIHWCVVGEPSSQNTLADTLRIGRRGSLTGYLTIIGKQGHVAYPHLARNPIHLAAPFLEELIQTVWDTGHEHFPPTSLQIANIQSGTGVSNVIPDTLSMDFNFRYNPHQSKESLTYQVISLLQHHNLEYTLSWSHSGEPFLTNTQTPLIQETIACIDKLFHFKPTLSTGGGTSDARFIAPTGAQVVELGVCNKSIHQINECVRIVDIGHLQMIYYHLLEKMALSSK